MLRVLVTRAEPQAALTAERIRAQGGEAIVAPVLRVEPVPADLNLAGAQALLFTSTNGVRAFAQVSPERALPALCVGDATQFAAQEAGFTQTQSANGDGEALAKLVIEALDPNAGALIHIAGEAIAFDLAQALAAHGFKAERRILYRTIAADALPNAIAARLGDSPPGFDAILFHSPRGAAVFCALLDSHAPQAFSALTAVCLSQDVAAAAAASPWKRVRVADAPREDALLETLMSLAAREA
ncbi:MAG: uroporphyrinogen-III synthase [Hyphomonadaceae bacterium]